MLTRTTAGFPSRVITAPFMTTTGLENCAFEIETLARTSPATNREIEMRFKTLFILRKSLGRHKSSVRVLFYRAIGCCQVLTRRNSQQIVAEEREPTPAAELSIPARLPHPTPRPSVP